MGRNILLLTPILWHYAHQRQEGFGRRPRFWFWMCSTELRDDLVVYRDLHAGALILPDLSDQSGQALPGLTD
jgi:hypothetical protein